MADEQWWERDLIASGGYSTPELQPVSSSLPQEEEENWWEQDLKSSTKAIDIAELVAPKSKVLTEPEKKPSDWDTLRGIETSMRQVPQLAYGVAGLVGATTEELTGYGEALRDWGFRGYKDWEQSIEPISKETDSVTVAWNKAKEGDIGALVDWAQYGVGYALGQLGETAAVSVLGGLAGGAAGAAGGPTAIPAAAGGAVLAAAGKTGFKALATNLVEKAIAKQALKIAEEQATKQGIKLTAEQLAKQAETQAVKKLAGKEIGSNAAIFANSIGMELGSIYGEAESQAKSEGRELTGVELSKIWGAGLAAGGLEGVTDKLGLDLLKGKFAAKLPAGRLAGAAVAGGVGILGEGLTEAAQTAIERAGAGKDVVSDDAVNEYINAAALGALGGGVIGGAGGFISGNPKENAAAKAKVAAEAFKALAPESSKLVGDQANAVINEVVQETPDQKVARLKQEAQAATDITLEETPAPQAAQASITEREGQAITPVETPTGTRVEAAAYQAPDGTVYFGASHLDAMAKARDAGKIDQAAIDAKQEVASRETPEFGFATDKEAFIGRSQAEVVATGSGQMLVDKPATGLLHSNEVSLDAFQEAAKPTQPVTPTAAVAPAEPVAPTEPSPAPAGGIAIPQSTSLRILGKEATRAEYARLESEGMTREEAIADLQKRKEADKKAIRDSVAKANIGDIIRVTEDDGTVVDYEIVGDTTMRGTRLGIRKADGSGPSYGLEVDSGVPAHGMVAGGTIIKRSDWNAEQKAKAAAPTPEAAPAAVEPTPVTPQVTPKVPQAPAPTPEVREARIERDPEVQKAAQDLKAGTIDRDEYQRIVDMRMPLRKFETVPTPATNDDMLRGLGERTIKRKDVAGNEVTIKKQDLVQAPESIAEGTVLESRLDIPAYENADVWVVSLHEPRPNINKGNAGPVVAYTPTSVLRNVEFGVTEQAAANIAAGKPKSTIATMKGEFVPMTAEQAYQLANTNKDQWVEIGMNPVRHSYFYDKDTQTPVVSAEEVVQVGGMVLAKNPVFGKREDYLYARRVQMGRAGMDQAAVEARLQELGFPTGGIIRVVNEPDADFEGRTIILDGKVTGIELNASALKDNVAIDRVLNHELAESANADGALNKLVERLTPNEKKEINDTITRLRYEERARTAEEAARAIETLAEAWKGRGFFTRAVARVEAWASKLGFKLTRRAAEYIAARNLAEVNENVRKWHIGEAMANIKGARKVSFNGLQAVLIPPSEMRVAYSIAAYHGTPHVIKGGFQLEKIGTGEGAQAYGWGLYFAENIDVAREYQAKLSRNRFREEATKVYNDWKANNPQEASIFEDEVVAQGIQNVSNEDFAIELQNILDGFGSTEANVSAAEKLSSRISGIGNLYSVDLDIENDRLLDWDSVFAKQSDFIKNALQPIIEQITDANLGELDRFTLGAVLSDFYRNPKLIRKGSKKEVSEFFASQGIQGIKYLDRASRFSQPKKTGFGWLVDDYRGSNYFKTKEEALEFAKKAATSNFVVFDENLINITGLNGQPAGIRESRREPEVIPTFTEGTPEAATLKEMEASMAKVDSASQAKGGKPTTQKVSDIAANWMESGGDERALQDAITENTNLTPANAKRVASAIAKQYDIQQSIATAFLETQTGLSVEAIPEGATLPKEVDPDRPKPVMSRLFEVFMGVKVPPVKITVNEKTALKDQIRLKAAANRAAKEAQKETAAAVVEIIKQMELRGPVRQKQAQALAKRAAKVIWTSEKSLEAFTDYAARVMENTNYDADLREAKAAQARAKQLSKQKSIAMSPQRGVLEDISKVAVNSIDDPRIFAESVNYYLRGFKKVTSPDYVVVPDTEMTSYLSELETQEINSFAERERLTNEKLAEQYGIPISEVESLLNSQDIIRDLATFAKREKVESILNQKVSDVQTVLKGYDQAQLRGDQRKLVDALISVDTNSLDAKEKQTLIRIGNNVIYNNQTNGAQYFVAVANGQQNARQAAKDTKTIEKNRAWVDLLPTLGSKKVKEAMRNWSLELQSVADTFRNIFGKEGMAKMFRQMGMYNLDRGFTDAANVLDQIQEKMAEFYKKNTQKYRQAARDQNGILSEGVVGFLIQAVPAKGEQESIAQRRDLIKQDIANRRSDTQQKDKIDMANRIEEILNKIDGNSVEEILANMKANYRPNYDSLTYLMNDLLPQYKDFLKQFDENFNDQANNYDNPYYLPIAFIRSGPELEITPESESMFYEGMSLRPKQAANTIKRVDYSVLPKDKSGNPKEIQFNLRRGTYDSLSDQINKAYTNEAWQQIFSFMKTAEATDVFGGRANKDFMAERLNRLRISRMRRGSANNGAIAKFADSVSVLARKIGTGIALGGVFQVFKQSPDQLISAIGTTGRYDLLAESIGSLKSAKPFLDKFSIGRRGDASSGYKYINQMERAQNRLERAFTESRWSEVKENASKVADVWMVALKKTDFLCAAGAWMTYYRANLDKNGIKFEGWEKEAQLVDSDTSRQDAASYAEQMTDIYQGSSDPTKMATFAQSGKSGWENFVKAAIVPFNSFAIQQRMRIYSDGRDSFTKAGDTGMAGRFGLASTIGGLVAFHTMRRLVLPTITGAGVYTLYAMLGVDMDEPDEEKKKAEANKNWRQFQGEILANTLVGGAPQFVEAATIDAFNYANYLVSLQLESEDIIDDDGKIMEFSKYQKERSPFWRYQSFKNAPSFGMFDVGLGQAEKVAVQTKQLMDREQMEMYTPEEQRLLYFSTLSEWMYLMRLNDADFARMVGKARRDMIKASEDREKRIKAIRSGR